MRMMMTMMTPPLLLLLLLSYLAVITIVLPTRTITVNAQQNYYSTKEKPKKPSRPIGDVLFMIFDTDKNGEVTLTELQKQLHMIQGVFAPQGNEHQEEEDEESKKYRHMLKMVTKIAPQLFELLDANEDGTLKMWEFKFVTKLEKSFQKGGDMKQVLRDCFALVDYNGDDEITKIEWQNAPAKEITAVVHDVFPLRPTPEEFHTLFVKFMSTASSTSSSSRKQESADDGDETATEMNAELFSRSLFTAIDENKDGILQRGEVSIAYNKAGRQFLEMSKSIKQMGPMLAMFGSGFGDNAGFGNSRDEF